MNGSSQDILIQIGADISQLTDSMRLAQQQIEDFGNGTQDAAQGGAMSLGKLAGALGIVAVAAKGFGMLKDSIGSAFSRIDVMESFDRVMTELTGSTDEAAAALDKTSEAVTGTAYGLDTAAKSVQDFVTRGMSVEKATDTMAAWGDAVAFYGDGSNEQLANVSDALAKMVSSGKVGMDQMNRLYDAGIDGPGMYAKATGMSQEEVKKQLSSGKISAQDFIDTVSTAMMEGTNGVTNIAGAAKDAGASWGASFDNMKAAVTRGMIDIITNIDKMLVENGLPDMRAMVAEFGKKFEQVIKAAAAAIPPIVEKIKEVYETLKPWIPLITAVIIAVGSFVAILATVTTAVSIFNKVKVAAMAMNTVLMANPYIIAIAAIIGLAYLIYKYWDEIVAFTKVAWGAIKAFFSDLWTGIKDTASTAWNGIKSFFSNMWTGIIDGATNAWNGFIGFFVDMWASIKESVSSAWGGIKSYFSDLWSSITGTATDSWSGFVGKITGIWDSIVAKATEIWGTVSSAIMAVVGPIIEYVMTQFNTIKTGVTTIFGGLVQYFTGAWELIKNIFLGAILLIVNLFQGDMEELVSNAKAIFENIKEAVSQMWEGIKTIFTGALEMILAYVSNAWNFMKDTISSVMTVIQTAISEAWTAIKTFVSETITAMVTMVTTKFTEMKTNAANKVTEAKTAVSTGFTDMVTAVKTKITEAVTTVKTKFTEIVTAIKTKTTESVTAVKTKFTEMKTAIATMIPQMVTTVKTKFTEMVTAVKTKMTETYNNIKNGMNDGINFLKGINLKSIGMDIIQGLINGIKDKVNAVKDAVKDVGDAITGKIKGILGIKSPSRVMMAMGRFTGQGLVNGIVGMKSKVEDAAAKMTSWMTPETPEIAPMAFNGPTASQVAKGSYKTEQDIQHTIAERHDAATKPAQINLQLSGRDYDAFVEDIDGNIQRKARLKRKTTGRG